MAVSVGDWDCVCRCGVSARRDELQAHASAVAGPHTPFLAQQLVVAMSQLEAMERELHELRAAVGGLTIRRGVSDDSWVAFQHGARIDVDTTAAGFQTDNVQYTTSLTGDGSHWSTTGSGCIYPHNDGRSLRTGFTIYIQFANGTQTIGPARQHNWRISWTGTEVTPPPPM